MNFKAIKRNDGKVAVVFEQEKGYRNELEQVVLVCEREDAHAVQTIVEALKVERFSKYETGDVVFKALADR